MNGTNEPQILDLKIYREVIPANKAYDVISDSEVTLGNKLEMPKRGIYVLCF